VALVTVVWTNRDGRADWSGRTLAAWMPELVAEVVDVVDPESVYLFGSVARGQDGPHSDLDLLVVLDELDPAEVVGLKVRVIRAVRTPVPFDVAFTDSKRMTARAKVAGSLERAAQLEGQLVYARS
jgi:predicted nucleotidyltransferase